MNACIDTTGIQWIVSIRRGVGHGEACICHASFTQYGGGASGLLGGGHAP
jgi:hypothetical protein